MHPELKSLLSSSNDMCTVYADNRNVGEDFIMEQFGTIMPIMHEDRSGMTETHSPSVSSSTSDHGAIVLICILTKQIAEIMHLTLSV